MKKIGIAINPDKHEAKRVALELIEKLEQKDTQIYLDSYLANEIGRQEMGIALDEFPSCVHLVFVLGGDGTLLGMARRFAKYRLPILGFNVGNLGFLSEAEPENLSMAVDRVMSGDYVVEERLMVEAEVIRNGKVIERGVALNDIGIAKGSFGRIISCTVEMNGMPLGSYSGDGLIVSTPTGSTAYSLSCGGPIVYPEIQALLLTPICPHTLTSRPMVLPANSVLEMRVSASHLDMGITIDGQIGYPLQDGDMVRVKKSDYPALLIKWQERSFFEVVRKKLQGESSDVKRAGGKDKQ